MVEQVERLLNQPLNCECMGNEARKTIAETWNAEESARRFVVLCNTLLGGAVESPFENGPCSRAEIMSDKWYRDCGRLTS